MKIVTRRIRIPRGRRSPEVASFFAQLDALSDSMLEDLRGAGAGELSWQAKRGQNTIGMLLAHIAIVEVYWLLIAAERYTQAELERLLGIGEYDDGMPLSTDGAPPTALRGKSLAWYVALLRRARSYSRRQAARFVPADLDRLIQRTRPNGQRVRQNIRWILYHVLEHQAGHYGQVLLLRHQYADRRKR